MAELEKAGCEKVYSEHKSGIKARLELAEATKYLRKGDILVVYKFDRLGRSLSDLLNIISELHEKEYRYNLSKTISIRHPHLAN